MSGAEVRPTNLNVLQDHPLSGDVDGFCGAVGLNFLPSIPAQISVPCTTHEDFDRAQATQPEYQNRQGLKRTRANQQWGRWEGSGVGYV